PFPVQDIAGDFVSKVKVVTNYSVSANFPPLSLSIKLLFWYGLSSVRLTIRCSGQIVGEIDRISGNLSRSSHQNPPPFIPGKLAFAKRCDAIEFPFRNQ
ncbi:5788_t:CDS:2, partial [Funneliformis geosporum]